MKPYKNQFAQPRTLLPCDISSIDDGIVSKMARCRRGMAVVDPAHLRIISTIVSAAIIAARYDSRMEF
jgi:hypothetical protein